MGKCVWPFLDCSEPPRAPSSCQNVAIGHSLRLETTRPTRRLGDLFGGRFSVRKSLCGNVCVYFVVSNPWPFGQGQRTTANDLRPVTPFTVTPLTSSGLMFFVSDLVLAAVRAGCQRCGRKGRTIEPASDTRQEGKQSEACGSPYAESSFIQQTPEAGLGLGPCGCSRRMSNNRNTSSRK